MSREWQIECSCGASTPEDGVRAPGTLVKIVDKKSVLVELMRFGIPLTVGAGHKFDALDENWIRDHADHVWRVVEM